jgi:hypothetical protein
LLGIFQGKKREYNELILKGLLFGPKTTTQIAEYIYLNRKAQVKPKQINQNEVKKIISIISREKSRLEELKTKEYIYQHENLWFLSLKGMGVALTFYSVMEVYPCVKPFISSIIKEFENAIKQNPIFATLIEEKALKLAEEYMESQEFFQLLKDLAEELIRQGMDLDKTSSRDFLGMLAGKFLILLLPKIVMGRIISKEGVRN